MTNRSLLDVNKLFIELSQSSVSGVLGVWMIDSGKPGPTVGITIMTHGNEPSGLAVYNYFRNHYILERRIIHGRVFFVLNNLVAGEKYIQALTSKDEEAKRGARFIDLNMNRLPEDALNLNQDPRYEVQRAIELQKIWAQFDHALDIHSTSQKTKPMIIVLARSNKEIVSSLPIGTVISNIDEFQSGKPSCYFYGQEKAEVYGIEAGGHEIAESLNRAIVCSREFLALLGIIPAGKFSVTTKQTEYQIFGSLWFPNDSYELVAGLHNFQPVLKNSILADGNNGPIFTPQNCHLLMVPKNRKQASIKEEVLFFANQM